jgi:thiol-disulfide isomerase/thioredoxin
VTSSATTAKDPVLHSALRAASLVVIVAVGLLGACDSASGPAANEPKQSRFNAATKHSGGDAASKSFCEAVFPRGEQGRPFVAPAEKPLPGVASVAPASKSGTWKYVNLWATWCRPCVEEMALLDRWQQTLRKDGLPIDLVMYSVDDGEADLQGWLKKGTVPGTIRWLKGGAADLPTVLEGLGVAATSPIPVHALIDGDNHVRCVRVGSVHQEDYAAIKAIIAGG